MANTEQEYRIIVGACKDVFEKNQTIGFEFNSALALIQYELTDSDILELDPKYAVELYEKKAEATLELLLAKNHDYGEAWREMRISSITDIILMKIYRTKQIEDNNGETIISEGVDANYMDMLNYSVFCLIKMTG